MHPSPMADTSRLLFPSLRFCIVSPFGRSVLGAGVAESHLMAARAKMVPSLPPINPEPRMPTRMLLSLPLQLLARGPEQDFVHVYIARLAHCEDDYLRKRSWQESRSSCRTLQSLRSVRLAHAVWQLRGYRTRRYHGRADVVTLP